MFKILFLLSLNLVFLTCSVKAAKGPEVKIGDGSLLGAYDNSRNGRQYSKFLGVPFGHVPKRFDMPQPVKPWNGTRMATTSGSGCARMSFDHKKFVGTENCLTLDVYTPRLFSGESNENGTLPVMVWFYGGGFIYGSTQYYDGKYFMDEGNVVLVAINYRLGAFGFLNAEVKSARGNQGLKDMVLGLKWVQKHISQFGGNASQVTIFGESAGGAAVSLLTLSPMAKELFQGAIMQSSTALCPYVIQGNSPPLQHAKKLAAAVDCPSSNSQYLVECLQRVKPEELAKHINLVNEFGFKARAIHLGPTIEKSYNGESNDTIFLQDDPFTLVQNGDFHKVPMIIGIVSNEMHTMVELMLSNPNTLEKLNCQFGRIIPDALFIEESAEDQLEAVAAIKKFFFDNKQITNESVHEWEALQSDRHFFHCTRVMAAEYAKFVPVYAYNYTRRQITRPMRSSQNSVDEDSSEKERPASHADELQYMFQINEFTDEFPKIVESNSSVSFSKSLVSLWTSFARDGQPEKLWGSWASEWLPLEVGKPQQYLQIDNEPFMAQVTEQFQNRWKFWDSLSLKENGKSWKCSA